jgi:hypothetical protein
MLRNSVPARLRCRLWEQRIRDRRALLEEISEPIFADAAGGGGDVLVAFGALWVTFFDDATLIRIPLN